MSWIMHVLMKGLRAKPLALEFLVIASVTFASEPPQDDLLQATSPGGGFTKLIGNRANVRLVMAEAAPEADIEATDRQLFTYRIPGSLPEEAGLFVSGYPVMDEEVRCEKRGDVGASGTKHTIGHRLFTEDGYKVGVSGETVHVPAGRYRLETSHVKLPWRYSCAGVMRTTAGETKSLWTLRYLGDEGTVATDETWITIGKPTLSLYQEPECKVTQNPDWTWEFDGCSVYTKMPGSDELLEPPLDRNNPAGGGDTHYSNHGRTPLPINRPCGKGDDCGPCDRHDICYQTCGADRGVCDARMYLDMISTCAGSSEPPNVKERCLAAAATYYQGLVRFGEGAFAERQEQVCRCE